jgi:hypothetical protein
MADDGGPLPDWVFSLEPLTKVAPFATSMFVLMTDPVRWLRSGRGQDIFEWIVGFFLVKPFVAAQSYFLAGIDRLADSLGWLADGAVSVTFAVAGPFLEIPDMFAAALQGVLENLGLAAPIAGAVTSLILFLIGGAMLFALFYGILAATQTDGIVEGVGKWF